MELGHLFGHHLCQVCLHQFSMAAFLKGALILFRKLVSLNDE